MHATNEVNARKAELCDQLIATITDNINKSAIDLSDINVSLEAIPNLITTIGNCSATMHDINAKCADVERQMFELEDLMEVLQMQETQLDSKFDMAMFKERKLANLEMVRQSLAVKHESTIKKSEKQMRSLQLERQSVFQNAFESDLNYYKEVGKIPSKFLPDNNNLQSDLWIKNETFDIDNVFIHILCVEIEHKQPELSLTLEEIVLDDELEKNELNDFLASVWLRNFCFSIRKNEHYTSAFNIYQLNEHFSC